MEIFKEPRQKLKNTLLDNSVEKENFIKAKFEWKLTGVQYQENGNNCICGQRIKRVCFIENKIVKTKLIIGVDCANQFLDFNVNEKLFDFLPKLKENEALEIPLDIVTSVFALRYIYEREVEFLKSLIGWPANKQSEKQKEWRRKIVRRILNQLIIN